MQGFISELSTPSIGVHIYSHVSETLFISMAFHEVFETRKCESCDLTLFKIILVSWNSLRIHLNIQLHFYFCKKRKCHWDFNRDCIETMLLLGSTVISTILSLPIHENEISFLI